MQRLMHWLGMEPNPVSLKEKLVSTLGAFIGIALTAVISLHYFPLHDAMLMVGSMGASAVLLFAVPHGQLSQPWPAVAGQLLSAAVGISCALLVPNPLLAASLAVSLAILAMHLTRSMHPPGGATALIAVIGGPEIHALGYGYVLLPVALNAASILLVALLFNNLFGWRRYPASLSRPVTAAFTPPAEGIELADLEYAIRELDSTIDVTREELLQLYAAASRHRGMPDQEG
ncbi:MAG TPA: HPP family protein [Mariprofundaceae bacterium]|nr:HPP family protein [Mariprofundaceae bacterium]